MPTAFYPRKKKGKYAFRDGNNEIIHKILTFGEKGNY